MNHSTDYGQLQGSCPDRGDIPLTDAEAHVTFYLAEKKAAASRSRPAKSAPHP